MKNKKTTNSGQTLVTLLIFMVTAITITTAATVMIVQNTRNTSRFEQGEIALSVAESGAENALLRLLRNPVYAGETIAVGDGTAVISVINGVGNEKIITSEGQVGGAKRTIQVIVDFSLTLTVTSWKEVYN